MSITWIKTLGYKITMKHFILVTMFHEVYISRKQLWTPELDYVRWGMPSKMRSACYMRSHDAGSLQDAHSPVPLPLRQRCLPLTHHDNDTY